MKTKTRTFNLFFRVLALLAILGNGCTKGKASDDDEGSEEKGKASDDDEGSEELCSERACFSQCSRSEWIGLESYWALSARCVEEGFDEPHCSCDARCDDALCTVYCQEERDFLYGACDFLSCVCSNTPVLPGDAGDLDGGANSIQDAGR